MDESGTATNEETHFNRDFTLVPNPAHSSIQINGDKSIAHFCVFDATGKPVLKGNQSNVEVSALENGIYFIQITTNQGDIQTKTFVKD